METTVLTTTEITTGTMATEIIEETTEDSKMHVIFAVILDTHRDAQLVLHKVRYVITVVNQII